MDGKTDRRVIKTKERLYRVFVELLAEKPVKDITVKELSEKADINRATFYLHYNDVFHLLEQIEEEIVERFEQVCSGLSIDFSDEEFLTVFKTMLDFIKENRKLCSGLFGENGDKSFFARLVRIVMSKYLYSDENSKYALSFSVAGCVGIIMNWIRNGMEIPSDVVAERTLHLVRKVRA